MAKKKYPDYAGVGKVSNRRAKRTTEYMDKNNIPYSDAGIRYANEKTKKSTVRKDKRTDMNKMAGYFSETIGTSKRGSKKLAKLVQSDKGGKKYARKATRIIKKTTKK